MKNKITILIGVIMVLFTSSCKYDPTISNPEEYATIYMAQGESLREFIFQQSKGSDRILIGANYGGVDEAPEDIRVKFEIDPSLVAQYNEANQTEFEQLPMNNISFPTQEAVIQKGKLQTQALPLDIDFTGLPTFTSYLLPVKISSSSGNVSINEQLQTAYFRIEVRSDPTPIKIMMLGKGGTNNDMDKLSQIIADANPDICIIREIDKFTNRSGSDNDWSEILFNKISLDHMLFVPSILSYQGGQYGMVVYSKYPMVNSETYLLAANNMNEAPGAERGPFAVLDLNVDGKILKFGAIHTASNATTRAVQLSEISTILGQESEHPFIFAGNFNANPNGGDSYLALSGLNFVPACTSCPPNFSVSNPATWSDMTVFRPSGRFNVVSHTVGNATQAMGTHLPVFTTVNVYF